MIPGQFIDIHIDELDPSLKPPVEWISGVQRLLAEGTWLLATRGDERFVLAGCIALRSSCEAIGINFANEVDLSHELDVTPPSLYLFWRGSEPWADHIHGFVQLDSPLRFGVLPQAAAMYLEYQAPTEVEMRRSLWLVPPDANRGTWGQTWMARG